MLSTFAAELPDVVAASEPGDEGDGLDFATGLGKVRQYGLVAAAVVAGLGLLALLVAAAVAVHRGLTAALVVSSALVADRPRARARRVAAGAGRRGRRCARPGRGRGRRARRQRPGVVAAARVPGAARRCGGRSAAPGVRPSDAMTQHGPPREAGRAVMAGGTAQAETSAWSAGASSRHARPVRRAL